MEERGRPAGARLAPPRPPLAGGLWAGSGGRGERARPPGPRLAAPSGRLLLLRLALLLLLLPLAAFLEPYGNRARETVRRTRAPPSGTHAPAVPAAGRPAPRGHVSTSPGLRPETADARGCRLCGLWPGRGRAARLCTHGSPPAGPQDGRPPTHPGATPPPRSPATQRPGCAAGEPVTPWPLL